MLAPPSSVPGVLVVSLDRSGRILSWNRACEEATGWTLDELRGREALPGFEGLTQPAPHRFEAPLPTREGAVRWIAWATAPRVSPAGQVEEILAIGLDITSRKQEEERLRAHAAGMEGLFMNAPTALITVDAGQRIRSFNRAAEQVFGWTAGEVIGGSFEVLLPERLRVSHRAQRPPFAATKSMEERSATHQEIFLLRKCGEEFPAEATMSETWLDGETLLVIAVHDATRYKRAQEEREHLIGEIEEERRWLQAVLDTVPVGVLLFEPGGGLSFNRRAETLLGLKLSPTGGSAQYRSRIFYRDGTPVPPEQFATKRVLENGETLVGLEYIIEGSPGSRIPILGSAAPIRDDTGKIIGAVGVFQDVSERMRAEEAIRANERLLNGIFDLLPVGVWIADHTGRIVRTNPAGLRVWAGARYVGVSEFAEYKGWWADTGKPIAPEDWALARALNKGETSLGEVLRIQCFDGTFKTIINSAMPLYDELGKFAGAIVVNEDITGLKEIEDALRRAVRARDETLGVVSHDLRSPLQAIELAARQLSYRVTREGGSEWIHASVERILRSSRTMRKLIEDLLDIVSIEEGRLSIQRGDADPASIIHEAADFVRLQAEDKQLLLEEEVGPGLPRVSVDRDRILQVFSNLMGNALKFTPAGGRLALRATARGEEVIFSVMNTGAGIPEEQRRHLFDRFWQADTADRRGRGLGLAIAKGIVEAHGGRIWVESEPGQGVTFLFSVPVLPPQAHP